MRTIRIPGVPIPLTQLVMGTGNDDYHPDYMDLVERLSDTYIELGGNTFDTAHQYEGSEEALGRWMEKRKLRDKVVILTKGAHPDDNNVSRMNAESIYADMQESLARLRVSSVDMYALHRDDPAVEVGEIMEALHRLVDVGQARCLGVSNWTMERVVEANRYAAEQGLTPLMFTSTHFSLAKAQEPMWAGSIMADDKYLDWHARTQTPLLAWSSQACGFFSGRFSPEERSNPDIVRVYYNERNWERLRRARIIAEIKGVKPIQVSLSYVLHQPFPSLALIGPEKIEELRSSFDATRIALDDEQLRWLDLRAPHDLAPYESR